MSNIKKKINERCPFAEECDRVLCHYINHELQCDYYNKNAYGTQIIEDQGESREHLQGFRADQTTKGRK